MVIDVKAGMDGHGEEVVFVQHILYLEAAFSFE
jgi:hypothetical protein